jgi:tRNA pseudouridine55 synthase
MAIVTVWKKIGETPLQAMERARKEYQLGDIQPACFTGRLDPMAQGVLTSLFGDVVKSHQDKFNACSKVYRFHAVLGISTSSYDPMGLINDVTEISYDMAMKYHRAMLNTVGQFKQPFPPYSAMRYEGHPLWWHAKNGSLPSIMPSKEREVFSIKALTLPVSIDLRTYRRGAIADINDVMFFNNGGDGFDCPNIIKEWRGLSGKIAIWRAQYEATVSSGTYIRSLVHDLGQQLGIPAHAARITRTRLICNK